jgi:hypothetical protein
MARRAATTRVPGYDERARHAAVAAAERPRQGYGNPRPPPPDRATHADIRAILLATGDEEIVEDTSTDHYWGRGRSGTGKNVLGEILMRTRTQLHADLAQKDSGQGRRQRS